MVLSKLDNIQLRKIDIENILNADLFFYVALYFRGHI